MICPNIDHLLLGRGLPSHAADDEWSPGLIDEDVVGFVDQGEVVLALHFGVERAGKLSVGGPGRPKRGVLPLITGHFEPVAEKIKAELRCYAVSNVTTVSSNSFFVGHLHLQNADGNAESLVDRSDPFGVAPSQVIV